MSATARPRGTWRQRCDLSSCLIAQHPTRGRPQFAVSKSTTRTGSPAGVFSEFKHFDGETYKEKRSASAALCHGPQKADQFSRLNSSQANTSSKAGNRSASAGAQPSQLGAFRRSHSAQSAATDRNTDKAIRGPKGELVHPHPWLQSSPSPGVPKREFSYTGSSTGGIHDGDSSKHRSQSVASNKPMERSASAASHLSGQSASLAPYRRTKAEPAAPPLDTSVVALLRRDLCRKSKDQLAAEEVQHRTRTAVSVRYGKVAPPSSKDLAASAKVAMQRVSRSASANTELLMNGDTPPQQLDSTARGTAEKQPSPVVADEEEKEETPMAPMHRASHEGLRVDYYDKGRKMTTAQLLGVDGELAEEPSDSLVASPIKGGPQEEQQEVEESPAKKEGEEETEEKETEEETDETRGARLWLSLRNATNEVKTVPNCFFEALRTLKTSPPQKVLFMLHLAVLVLEPHSVIPLPEDTVWPLARDVLRVGDFSYRLIRSNLRDMPLERMAAIKELFVATDAKWAVPKSNTADSNNSDSSDHHEVDASRSTEKADESPERSKSDSLAVTPARSPSTSPSRQAMVRSPRETIVERRRKLDAEYAPASEEVLRLVKEQSTQAAIVVHWLMCFIAAHDHIIRDCRAAPSDEPTS